MDSGSAVYRGGSLPSIFAQWPQMLSLEVLFPRIKMQDPGQWLVSETGGEYWQAVIVGGQKGHPPNELAVDM